MSDKEKLRQAVDDFLKKIQAIIGDKVNAELLTTSLPNESTMASPFYETIRRALTEMDPQAIVTPMMSSGASCVPSRETHGSG